MKTIFDIIGKKKELEFLDFDEYINNEGIWKEDSTTSCQWNNCLIINEDLNWVYYLAWDNNHTELSRNSIKRIKK